MILLRETTMFVSKLNYVGKLRMARETLNDVEKLGFVMDTLYEDNDFLKFSGTIHDHAEDGKAYYSFTKEESQNAVRAVKETLEYQYGVTVCDTEPNNYALERITVDLRE